MPHILSIDLGTSSARAVMFTEAGEVVRIVQKELSMIYPQAGWVEQDPNELVKNTVDCVCEILSDDRFSSVAGIGITNQRETTIVWDRKTGQPVYNAIVWQDRRTADLCDDLRKDGIEDEICMKTGLTLDPYFSATKIKWILDYVDGAKEKAINGDLLFGTVDCYLLWHLTGRKIHATDSTNASRTMLYNIHSGEWDGNLLKVFNIPLSMMPEVQNNLSNFDQLSIDGLRQNIRIGGMVGDQQSAMIGQGCIKPGMVKSTYGTGCFSLIHTGGKAVRSQNRLLTTIAVDIGGKIEYALEGAVFNAGTAVQFLRDNFGFFDRADQTHEMAVSVEDSGGVYFVPAFTGLGAPHWNSDARGVIYGLNRDTRKEHIVRAALEAQAFQTRDLMQAMESDSGQKITDLRADGGLVANEFMCQFISDILQRPIEIPRVTEATAWGAACLAGVQAGVFDDLDHAASLWTCEREYRPSQTKSHVDKLCAGWVDVVNKMLI